MVIARIGKNGVEIVTSPPNRPTTMILPPLVTSESIAKLHGVGRADEIDHRPSTAFGGGDDLLGGVRRTAVDRGHGAGLDRRLALDRIDVDHDDGLAAHRLVQGNRHQAEPAGAHDDNRFVGITGPTFLSALNAVMPEQASGAACTGVSLPMSNKWRGCGATR